MKKQKAPAKKISKPLPSKTKTAKQAAKTERPTILVNFKVTASDFKRLNAQAKKFAGGNRSRLLLASSLERRTPVA